MSLRQPMLMLSCALPLAAHADEAIVDLTNWQAPNFVAREKKVVGFVFAMPSPSQLRDHMADLEKTAPYLDGMVFKLAEVPDFHWPRSAG